MADGLQVGAAIPDGATIGPQVGMAIPSDATIGDTQQDQQTLWQKVKSYFSDAHKQIGQMNYDAQKMTPREFAAAHPELTVAPSSAEQSVADIKAGNYAKAIHRTATDLFAGLAPLAIPALAAAPVATLAAGAAGMGAQYVVKKGAAAAGLTPDQADVAGDVAGLAAGAGTGKLADSAAEFLGNHLETSSTVPIPGTGGAVRYRIRPEPEPNVQNINESPNYADIQAAKIMARREALAKLQPAEPEPNVQPISESPNYAQIQASRALARQQAMDQLKGPEPDATVQDIKESPNYAKIMAARSLARRQAMAELNPPKPEPEATVQSLSESPNYAKIQASRTLARQQAMEQIAKASPSVDSESAPFQSNGQDLISRMQKIYQPGESPTAADLKAAGDLTQAPLSRLQTLAKFGDLLAQKELARRLKQ